MLYSGTQKGHIGKDIIFQYFGAGSQFLSGIIFYLVIVRLFDTEVVGAVSIFLAIIGLFQAIFTFGLSTAAQHFTSYSIGKGDFTSASSVFYKLLAYGILLSIIACSTLLFLSTFIVSIFLHSSSYLPIVRTLSIVLVGNIIFGILNGILLGIQNFRASAIVNIFVWAIYYIAPLFYAYLDRSLFSLVIGWGMGILLGIVIELFIILKSLKKKGLTKGTTFDALVIFKYSFPILMSGMISYGAVYIDRFLVAGLLNLSSLGIYNFSLLISSSLNLLIVPFNNILIPKLSELYGQNDLISVSSYVNMSISALNFIYMPIALGVSALSPFIIEILGGYNYEGGATPLAIILIISSIFISSNIMGISIAAIRKTKVLIYSSSLSLIGNLSISFLMIPKFGIIGASFGYASVLAVSFCILFLYGKGIGVVSYDILLNFKIWLSAILMFTLVYISVIITNWNILFLPIYVSIGILIYVFLIRFFRVFKDEKENFILKIIPFDYKRTRKFITKLFFTN